MFFHCCLTLSWTLSYCFEARIILMRFVISYNLVKSYFPLGKEIVNSRIRNIHSTLKFFYLAIEMLRRVVGKMRGYIILIYNIYRYLIQNILLIIFFYRAFHILRLCLRLGYAPWPLARHTKHVTRASCAVSR